MTCKPSWWRCKLGVELPDGNTPYLVRDTEGREYAVLEEREEYDWDEATESLLPTGKIKIKVVGLWCDQERTRYLSEKEFEAMGLYQPEREA